ncbi:MAG TPA: hypothetical protein VF010_14285 [Methylomirabilota bacterium]|nr:hypothetical protein [Methylomirabilota bacterium]
MAGGVCGGCATAGFDSVLVTGFGAGADSTLAGSGVGVVGASVDSFLSVLSRGVSEAADAGGGVVVEGGVLGVGVTAGGGTGGGLGVATGAGAVALALSFPGGAFIASRMKGTATAPMTPRTMSTSTARNHVAAKIDRGAASSYRSSGP